jgi:hypothetical protein
MQTNLMRHLQIFDSLLQLTRVLTTVYKGQITLSYASDIKYMLILSNNRDVFAQTRRSHFFEALALFLAL